MDRGTYVAASGGLFQMRKLEIVNNNLSNINTPGFKKEVLVGDEETFDQTLASLVTKNDPYAKPDHDRVHGTVNVKAYTDFSAGPINSTGNPLDVAIRNPKDFFVINTANGPQYTRAGDFTLDGAGQIVTQDGAPVQGDGGPIVTNGPGVTISPNGAVVANRLQVGRLQVVRFDDPSQLERVGNSRFKLAQGQPAPQTVDADLVPGSLEMSNVSAITAMVDLIVTQKAFQMYTKSAETIDTMNQSAINQIGRSR